MLALQSFIFAAVPAFVFAQGTQAQVPIVYDAAHNATPIVGTWSTGSGAVTTGPGFANPINWTFNYPSTTGRSYSFSADNFFEQAEYRIASNASDPHCITGVITWQHGTYRLLDNGSIILSPFDTDGRQQVQDPCAAISNQINMWNITVLFSQWRIFPLPGGTGFHLHLFEWDGTPVAPMSIIANPPNMLPTSVLTTPGVAKKAPAPQTGPGKRDIGIRARSGALRTAVILGGVIALASLSSTLLILL